MITRTLDWRPHWDPKSNLYLISGLSCFMSGRERAAILRTKRVWFDQHQEGACTGFGTGHALITTPKSNPTITEDICREIYYEARRNDEYPGEEYEGSSVNGAMIAARFMTYIKSWHWCKTIAEVRHALSYHGPIVIGVNLYEGMYDPDPTNFIHVTGEVLGGHCMALVGYKTFNGERVYRIENSWGPSWGDKGGCWMKESGIQRLLREQGEFACPKKVPV